MVPQRISLDHFHRLDLFQPRLLCYLVLSFICVVLQMSDVSDVPDISDLVSEMLQKSDQDVICYSRSGMSEMRIPIYGGTAYIQSGMSRIDRLEQFFFTAQSIGDKKVSHGSNDS